MADHFLTQALAAQCRTILADYHRQVSLGVKPELAFAEAVAELDAATKMQLARRHDERLHFSIDWECAGLILADGLVKALNVYDATGNRVAAAKKFGQSANKLLRPRYA